MSKASRFEQFVNRFEKPVYGFFVRLVHDEQTADQLAQEAFLNLYRSGIDCNGGQHCVTAVYRTAIRLLMQRTELMSSEPVMSSSEVDQKVDAISLAISELPTAQRFAVLLHKYQGLDLAAIGKALDLDEARVKGLLLTGYQALTMKLSRYIVPMKRTH